MNPSKKDRSRKPRATRQHQDARYMRSPGGRLVHLPEQGHDEQQVERQDLQDQRTEAHSGHRSATTPGQVSAQLSGQQGSVRTLSRGGATAPTVQSTAGPSNVNAPYGQARTPLDASLSRNRTSPPQLQYMGATPEEDLWDYRDLVSGLVGKTPANPCREANPASFAVPRTGQGRSRHPGLPITQQLPPGLFSQRLSKVPPFGQNLLDKTISSDGSFSASNSVAAQSALIREQNARKDNELHQQVQQARKEPEQQSGQQQDLHQSSERNRERSNSESSWVTTEAADDSDYQDASAQLPAQATGKSRRQQIARDRRAAEQLLQQQVDDATASDSSPQQATAQNQRQRSNSSPELSLMGRFRNKHAQVMNSLDVQNQASLLKNVQRIVTATMQDHVKQVEKELDQIRIRSDETDARQRSLARTLQEQNNVLHRAQNQITETVQLLQQNTDLKFLEVRSEMSENTQSIIGEIRAQRRESAVEQPARTLAVEAPPARLAIQDRTAQSSPSSVSRTFSSPNPNQYSNIKVPIPIFKEEEQGFAAWAQSVRLRLDEYDLPLREEKRRLTQAVTGDTMTAMYSLTKQWREQGTDHRSDTVSWDQFIELIAPAFSSEDTRMERETAWLEVKQEPNERVDDYIKRKTRAFKMLDQPVQLRQQIRALVDGLHKNMNVFYRMVKGSDTEARSMAAVENSLRAAERMMKEDIFAGLQARRPSHQPGLPIFQQPRQSSSRHHGQPPQQSSYPPTTVQIPTVQLSRDRSAPGSNVQAVAPYPPTQSAYPPDWVTPNGQATDRRPVPPQSAQRLTPNRSDRPPMQCYNCKGYGHMSKDCTMAKHVNLAENVQYDSVHDPDPSLNYGASPPMGSESSQEEQDPQAQF